MAKISLGLEWLRARPHESADVTSDTDVVDRGALSPINDPRWSERYSSESASLSCEWLFNASAEPVLIVDVNTENIVEGNPAAASLFHADRTALVGSRFLQVFDSKSGPIIKHSFDTARRLGIADAVQLRTINGRELTIRLSLIRTSGESFYLVHPSRSADEEDQDTSVPSNVFDAIDGASAAFLVTDSGFRVEYANRAFLKMVKINSQDEVCGEPLARWIRLSEVQLANLGEQLSNRRAVEELTTAIWSEDHSQRRVEVSAVAVPDSKTAVWGFCIREHPPLH